MFLHLKVLASDLQKGQNAMKYMLKGRRYNEHQLLLLLLMLSYHSTDMVSLILLQVR